MQHIREWHELGDKQGYHFRLLTESGQLIREAYIRKGEEYTFQSLNPLKRMVEGRKCTVFDFSNSGSILMVSVQFEGSDTTAVVKAEELIRSEQLRRPDESERTRDGLQDEFFRSACPSSEGKRPTLEPISDSAVDAIQRLVHDYAPKVFAVELSRVGLAEEFRPTLIIDEAEQAGAQTVEFRGIFSELRGGHSYQVLTEAAHVQISGNSLVGIWSQMALGCLATARLIKDWKQTM
ncbi:MAG: hypothetical protein ACM3ZQ_10210 [Bacillota bacterium]